MFYGLVLRLSYPLSRTHNITVWFRGSQHCFYIAFSHNFVPQILWTPTWRQKHGVLIPFSGHRPAMYIFQERHGNRVEGQQNAQEEYWTTITSNTYMWTQQAHPNESICLFKVPSFPHKKFILSSLVYISPLQEATQKILKPRHPFPYTPKLYVLSQHRHSPRTQCVKPFKA